MPLFYTESGFWDAVTDGDAKVVAKYMAHKNKDKWLASRSDNNGDTALHNAVRYNRKKIVDLLLAGGADANAQNADKKTPLNLALDAGDYSYERQSLVRSLLAAHADPNIPSSGLYAPLFYAAYYKEDEALAQMLIDAKADVNVYSVLDSVLHKDATRKIAIPLLKAGARLDSAGENPGHIAAMAGMVDLLELLKKAGLDLKKPNAEGQSPLHVAAQNGRVEAVKMLLLEEGIDINLQDKLGQTALHKAAINGQTDIVQVLLAAGARADIEDDQKMTPLAWARQKDVAPMIRMLEAKEKETLSISATPLTAAVNIIPAASAETWVLMGDHQVARVGIYPELGRRLTEIFNFESRERLVVSENLKTGMENVTPFTPFDHLDEKLLQKAVEAFRKLGGTVENSVISGKRLDKKPQTGLGG